MDAMAVAVDDEMTQVFAVGGNALQADVFMDAEAVGHSHEADDHGHGKPAFGGGETGGTGHAACHAALAGP